MKITTIQIKLEYTEKEKTEGNRVGPIILIRNEDKQWNVIEEGIPRGLHPSEIHLIYVIQQEIISKNIIGNRS